MKNKTLTLIKHKLQWLTLLVALLGVSQGVWGATYPANTPVYVRSTTNYGTDVTLHVWDGSSSTTWPGQTMTYLGKSGIYYYWTYTFSYTFTNMIVVDGGSTKISGDSNGAVSSETENCITVTGSDYSWSTYDICDSFSTPSTVLDGTKVMYYINQSYGGTTLKVTNNKTDCIDENTEYTPIDNNNVYVLQSTGNVPSSLRVSNNCGSWAGAGNFENVTAANAAGARFVTGDSNSKTDATTLSTFTSSASSIKEGTSSITLTLTASKATSSYGPNSNIYAIVYVGSTKKGCLKLSTSAQTLDIDTSDLTEGSYTIKAVLSDGTIYYLDSTPISLTVVAPCTAPTVVTNSTVSSITASGATVKGTITDGTCSVTASGIAYGTSTNPTSGTSVVYTSGTEFSVNLTGLTAGTTYYFRTYATANGTTTYGEEYSFTTLYKEPSAIYIKGPIRDNGCWPNYNDTPLTKNGTTYSQTFSAYYNTDCQYGPKEFVLSTSRSDDDKLNGKKTFNGDGTNGWEFSKRSETNFNCTLDYSTGEEITLTVSFNTSTGEYTMTMTKAATCTITPTDANYTLSDNSYIYDGTPKSVTVTPATGYPEGTIYYGDVETPPTNAGTYTIKYSTSESGNYCEASNLVLGQLEISKATQSALQITTPSESPYCTNDIPTLEVSGGSTGGTVTYAGTNASAGISVTSEGVITATASGTIDITATMAGNDNYEAVVSQAKTFTFTVSPTITPSVSEVLNYVPVLFESNVNVIWSRTPEDTNSYLYETTNTTVKFKGKYTSSQYTIKGVSDGGCEGSAKVTVNQDTEQCN